jgi:NhaA family Na+:H+ antiporter
MNRRLPPTDNRRPLAPRPGGVTGDRFGGLSLGVAAAAALVWANWPHGSYARVWERTAPWSGALGLHLSVQAWVNQAVLLAFFAVVGLEIRRELSVGELRSLRRAATPVLGAAGGMVAPALIYSAVVAGGAGAGAWGVPMATDVAFALGALALIGGVSPRGRVFLMTLAVADDIFSIVILVAFYSHRVHAGWLAAGLVAVAAMGAAWWWRRDRPGPHWSCWLGPAVRSLLGAAAWWSLLNAGVEAAVVGVALGGLVPAALPRRPPDHARAPGHPAGAGAAPRVRRWELRLTGAVNVVVLPIFALANVGVTLGGPWLGSGAARRVLVAVAVARVVGKPLGIAVTTLVITRVSPGIYQPRIQRRGIVGVGAVASIGFTVPLLIIRTAMGTGELATGAVVGLLIGSAVGVGLGAGILRGNQPAARSSPSPG